MRTPPCLATWLKLSHGMQPFTRAEIPNSVSKEKAWATYVRILLRPNVAVSRLLESFPSTGLNRSSPSANVPHSKEVLRRHRAKRRCWHQLEPAALGERSASSCRSDFSPCSLLGAAPLRHPSFFVFNESIVLCIEISASKPFHLFKF